jgi:hypothetical protein
MNTTEKLYGCYDGIFEPSNPTLPPEVMWEATCADGATYRMMARDWSSALLIVKNHDKSDSLVGLRHVSNQEQRMN